MPYSGLVSASGATAPSGGWTAIGANPMSVLDDSAYEQNVTAGVGKKMIMRYSTILSGLGATDTIVGVRHTYSTFGGSFVGPPGSFVQPSWYFSPNGDVTQWGDATLGGVSVAILPNGAHEFQAGGPTDLMGIPAGTAVSALTDFCVVLLCAIVGTGVYTFNAEYSGLELWTTPAASTSAFPVLAETPIYLPGTGISAPGLIRK